MYIILTKEQREDYYVSYATMQEAKNKAMLDTDYDSMDRHVFQLIGSATRELSKWKQAELPYNTIQGIRGTCSTCGKETSICRCEELRTKGTLP